MRINIYPKKGDEKPVTVAIDRRGLTEWVTLQTREEGAPVDVTLFISPEQALRLGVELATKAQAFIDKRVEELRQRIAELEESRKPRPQEPKVEPFAAERNGQA